MAGHDHQLFFLFVVDRQLAACDPQQGVGPLQHGAQQSVELELGGQVLDGLE